MTETIGVRRYGGAWRRLGQVAASAAVVDQALGLEPKAEPLPGNQSDTAPDLSAVVQQIVTRGLVGPELPVLPAFVIDDRSEASQGEGFRDGTPAHALAKDGGGPGEPAAERFRELAHRSFSESRPRRPHSRERIQKRATTLVAGQPFF